MTITLKELSNLLGLSQTTVSRALNGYPEVNEDTRNRVLTAARSHNYAPNSRARGLATGRAMAIGHILPYAQDMEFANPIFSDFLAGAGKVYTKRGYSAHVSFVEPGKEEEVYRRLITQRAVDGVILHAPKEDDPRVKLLQDLSMPFGIHGRAEGMVDDYAYVEMDNRAALELATEHVVSLGHSRIALLNGPPGLNFSKRREDGFRAVMAAHGLALNCDWIHNAVMSEDYGYAVAKQLLNEAIAPTAFLAGSILVAMGVHRAALETGHTLGGDVTIVAHDDVLSYLPNLGETPTFTATRSSVHTAGEMLADIVIDQIQDPSAHLAQEMLSPDLVIGRSSGPAPS